MNEIEGKLFQWVGRNRLQMKAPTGLSKSRDRSPARIAMEFARQFDSKVLHDALASSGADCEGNSNPGTLAWYVRRLVVVATDLSETKTGSFRTPVKSRMDAVATIRELQIYGAITHEPVDISLETTKGDNQTDSNFNENFRKALSK